MWPVFRVFRRELLRIGNRSSMWGLMIAAPLILFVLLASIYGNRVVYNLPVAVVDLDHGELSRLVVRSLDATKTLHVTADLNSVAEAAAALKSGHIQGAFVIPDGFEADIKEGRPAKLTVYKNTANLMVGNYILKEASTISRTISAGISYRKAWAGGVSSAGARNVANPIRIDTHVLYNPTYNYENFLVPGLLTVLFQMIVMLSSVMVVNDEVREQTFSTLIAAADGKTISIFLGKAGAFLFVHSATAIGLITLLFPFFGIPIHGSRALAVGYTLYFTAASFFPAMLISTFIPDRLTANTVAVFVNTPAFIFSGYTFPLWAMPHLHVWFARLLPSTHYLEGFIDIYQRGAPLSELRPYLVVLSLFVWVPIPLILAGLHRMVRRAEVTA